MSLFAYINVGLRILFGTISGAVRLAPGILYTLLTGKHPPPYYGQSKNLIEQQKEEYLGASLLQKHVVGGEHFTDITIINKDDGVKLHAVVDTGSRRKRGKRPIVFVHGFPELWVSWYEQLEHFSALGHAVLAFDMRGYGLSDKPTKMDRYDLKHHLVKDVRAVVHYATHDLQDTKTTALKPLLVGHDWGASVCWAFACEKQTILNNEIAGYVSLTLPPPRAFEENLTLKQLYNSLYMVFFNMPWLPEKLFLARNAWFIGVMMNLTKRVKIPVWLSNTYRTNCLQDGAMTAQFNYYRCLIQRTPQRDESDYGSRENPLPLTTLILRGMDDGALGDDIFRNLDKYLLNNKTVAFNNCSHWIQADCPDEVNSEIELFLANLS